MPQLSVRGIPVQTIKTISTAMINELADLCECGTDNFTIDVLQAVSVFDGALADTYPFVEVAWFERGGEIRDKFAAIVTRHAQLAGVAEMEVAFKVYREDAYYINGVPCKKHIGKEK